MARVNNNGISGVVGNFIFYTVNGVNYVRSKPAKGKHKRNQPENVQTTVFGTVSKYGSPMITQLGKYLLYHPKLPDYNRARGWMRNQYAANYLASAWPITAYNEGICKINNAVDIRDCLFVDVSITTNQQQQLVVEIPALNPTKQIKAPLHTKKVSIKAIVVASNFGADAPSTVAAAEQQTYLYEDVIVPATSLVLATTYQPSAIAIVALALEYTVWLSGKEVVVTDDAWLPAAIIAMGRV